MKRVILLLVAVLTTLGQTLAQNIVIGERAPELKNVVWLDSRTPGPAPLSLLVFFHSSNRSSRESLSALKELSCKLDTKLRIVVVTQEETDEISPLLSPYLSERFCVALDRDKKAFGAYGVEFIPFGVLIDSRNRVVWMGNPNAATEDFIRKISQ